jgi:lactate dehydrogenase-like 2-hydroxyacid dehydrogenase
VSTVKNRAGRTLTPAARTCDAGPLANRRHVQKVEDITNEKCGRWVGHPPRDKRILITRGAGIIGSALTGRLLDAKQVVVHYHSRRDALSRKSVASHLNLSVVRRMYLGFAAGIRHWGCEPPL